MNDVSDNGRLIVVANRLPVTQDTGSPRGDWRTSPGGLVSALGPLIQARDGSWVGWPGTAGDAPEPFRHDGIHLVPVPVSAEELDDFYLGFSNSSLWPLYHDAVRWPEFHRHWWWPYVEVNERFARATAEIARPGDMIWVHDYHLQLVPAMLRELVEDVRIGFFLHIPFPPTELFAQLPWRTRILEGLLGADLVGFQTKYGARNFVRAVERFTTIRGTSKVLDLGGRRARVGPFPISIDVDRYSKLAERPETKEKAKELRASLGEHRKVFLGVDRLDYTKGIDSRLRAFETLLERLGDKAEDVTFLQIAVPSRELVPKYAEIRTRVEGLVGRINGKFGSPHYTPVHYMYRNLTNEELVATYVAADVMTVTPLRDGMNLVAKEFVASSVEERGVLILSEFAGAARELDRALMVNPHDIDGMAQAFQEAIEMPETARRERMRALRLTVGRYDVHAWALQFLAALQA